MKLVPMKDFLNEIINFENIDLVKIVTLIRSISGFKDANFIRVKQKFEETTNNFEDVLVLLIQLNLVKIDGSKLLVADTVNIFNKKAFTETIIKTLFDKNLSYNPELSDFINHFVFKNGKYWFLPNRKLRLRTSGIRNFLISLEFLKYDRESDYYFISEEGIKFILKILDKNRLTPLQLSRDLARIEKIGAAAEEEIFIYEKFRLLGFPDLIKDIRHISKERVNAGYDLLSYSGNPTFKNPIFRYIEVKAVSIIDNNFYWSKNELAVAKVLGEQYYLYLVPVKEDSIFDVDNLLMIQDPYKNIFENEKGWKQQIELMSFSITK